MVTGSSVVFSSTLLRVSNFNNLWRTFYVRYEYSRDNIINIYPNYNAATLRPAYYGLIPLASIILATMVPSTKLLTEMLSTEVVECPLGRD